MLPGEKKIILNHHLLIILNLTHFTGLLFREETFTRVKSFVPNFRLALKKKKKSSSFFICTTIFTDYHHTACIYIYLNPLFFTRDSFKTIKLNSIKKKKKKRKRQWRDPPN